MKKLPNTQTSSSWKMKLLFSCFFAIMILLIINVFLDIKDFNDEWILAGSLHVYFLLFVLAYCVLVGFSSSLKSVTIATSVFLVVLNLIPNLKYVFIYGYHDPIGHHGFIQEMINSGHVPRIGVYSNYYGPAPGLHIFISALSQITGLNVSTSMKIFLVVFPSILPVAVYFVARRLNIPNGLAKMMVVCTSITAPITYYFSGPSASYYLYVLFIYCFLLFVCLEKSRRSNFLIALLFGGTIIICHSMTSFFLSLCLPAVLLTLMFMRMMGPYKTIRWRTPAFLGTTIVVMSLAHFIFVAYLNFRTIFLSIESFVAALSAARPPVAFSYYSAFYELNLLEKVEVLAVQVSRDAVSLFLTILAPLAIFRLKLKNEKLRKFYRVLIVPLILAISLFLASLLLFAFSVRGLYYLAPYSPFLAGATLFYIMPSKDLHFKHTIQTIAIFSLICVTLLQVYPFQPLIPKISTNYGNYYVLDLRQVNTVYDRSLISFINTYDLGLNIATDYLTWWQIGGLADPSVQALLTRISPLSTQNLTTPLLILVHNNITAHIVPSARDATANQEYIQNALLEENILYTNGKSYVLLNLPIRFDTD